MGSILMYELLATERVALYRRETEHDRQLALLAAERRQEAAKRREVLRQTGRETAARANGHARSTRRALAKALVGLAALSPLRSRKSVR
jgi:hypothetical protein